MQESVEVAVIGSGPAGLSAACHAAECGVSHVLLEAAPQAANTLFRYQKGKHVMAEPGILPLRSPLPFDAGRREAILEGWNQSIESTGVKIEYGAEVTAISSGGDGFDIRLANDRQLTAKHVVLAIGLQGNLRRLGCDGDDAAFVGYQLDDPDEFVDQTIVVVGAGDAAIENALALAEANRVIVVNRRDEFTRAKDANNTAIMAAIDSGALECHFKSTVDRVEVFPEADDAGRPGAIHLNTADGSATIASHHIIGRLGAIPPRKFVESCGIEFPNDDPISVPAVSTTYESNVSGLYIVGALAGYPLIKQAMNQGYEVIEYIQGHDVEPADAPLLREKFRDVPGFNSVDESVAAIGATLPLLSSLTPLQLREFLVDSTIHVCPPDEVIFRHNEYSDSFYSILEGTVSVQVDPDDASMQIELGKAKFFGEMSLISGRRRSATVTTASQAILIETPRRSMNKLIQSVDAVKRYIDEAFLLRAIQASIAPGVPESDLREVVTSASVESFRAGSTIFKEGDNGDCLQLIRSGSVTVSREIGDKEIVLAYVPAGKYVGEMALISDSPRTATVRAAVNTETIRLDGLPFKRLMSENPEVRTRVFEIYKDRLSQNLQMESQPDHGNLINFMMEQGLGEATDVLLIDESTCVRCDQCEKACADTHGNVSRLNREAGPSFAEVHVPTSCRHCEHPHCMKDCPPDAIHRSPSGEVVITDSCIGCGNCERNCPYGVIQMGVVSERPSSLFSWLLTGLTAEPGAPLKSDKKGEKRAVKCDMCRDLGGGPACVRACPTGAAIRISPEEFIAHYSKE